MKKLILLACLFLPWAAFAQAPQHSATLTWGASTTTGVSYHVYRATCTGTITGGVCSQAGTYSIIGTVNVLTYADTLVSGGEKLDYYVTAFCPTAGCSDGSSGESNPSNHWAGTIPKDVGA